MMNDKNKSSALLHIYQRTCYQMRKMSINFEDGGTNRNHHKLRPSRLGHHHHHHHHHRNNDFSRLGVRILLSSMVVGLFYLVLSHSSVPIQLLQRSYSLNYLLQLVSQIGRLLYLHQMKRHTSLRLTMKTYHLM